MIAQGSDSPKDFLTERNSSDYFRRKKIHWRIKDQARARVSGEKSGLEAYRAQVIAAAADITVLENGSQSQKDQVTY